MSTLAQSIRFGPEKAPHASRGARIARFVAWVPAIAFGAVQILTTPYRPSSEDIVSYLDVADAYRRHDWHAAINGYWSPLYSWVLAAAESLVHPPPAWELPFVRLVNFAIFLLALAAFDFFLQQLIAAHEAAVLTHNAGPPPLTIPRWMWRLSGYSLFVWSSLIWTGLRTDTPDLCAAALVLVAAGMMLNASRAPWSRARSFALGAVAGLAYLARTANFPIALLLVAGVSGGDGRRRFDRSAWALFAFAIVALPFVAALSTVKHRVTIGDSGRMNYVWNVNPGGYSVPGLHWQGGPAGSGAPVHPTRRVWTEPEVFEFEHGDQTYPPWTDPSYWYDGLQVRFSAGAQLRAVVSNVGFYGRTFLPAVAVLYGVLLVARAFSDSLAALLKDNGRLLLVAGAGLLTYLFGTNLWAANIPTQPSTRYAAVFIVLLFGAMVSGIRVRDCTSSRRLLAALTLVVTVMLGGRLVAWSTLGMKAVAAPAPTERLWDVAVGLRDAGIGPGSAVAILGRKGEHEFWARVGRIRIIAQIPDADAFLHADPAVQEQVLDALARTGAMALVGNEWAASHRGRTWQHLGASSYYAVDLARRARR